MHPCQAKKKKRRVLTRERRKVSQALFRWVLGQNNEGAVSAHEVVIARVSACLQEYRLWSMARSRRLVYRGP